jgi:hypothetical protein
MGFAVESGRNGAVVVEVDGTYLCLGIVDCNGNVDVNESLLALSKGRKLKRVRWAHYIASKYSRITKQVV